MECLPSLAHGVGVALCVPRLIASSLAPWTPRSASGVVKASSVSPADTAVALPRNGCSGSQQARPTFESRSFRILCHAL